MTNAKRNRNLCSVCDALGIPPPCKGHGKGGGSGSGGGSDNGDEKESAKYMPNQAESASTSRKVNSGLNASSQFDTNNVVSYEAGLLSIEGDRLRGNLTFALKPGLSLKEQELAREFLKIIKAEFNEFKARLAEQGISAKDFTASIKNDELIINIRHPKYYNEFIKHLESKNLLPLPEMLTADKSEVGKPFHPSPFKTKNKL